MCIFNNCHWLPYSICLWRPLHQFEISVGDHRNITQSTTRRGVQAEGTFSSVVQPWREQRKPAVLPINQRRKRGKMDLSEFFLRRWWYKPGTLRSMQRGDWRRNVSIKRERKQFQECWSQVRSRVFFSTLKNVYWSLFKSFFSSTMSVGTDSR